MAGETYAQIAEGTNFSYGQIQRFMKKAGIISQQDNIDHWRKVMELREEKGVRVGRRPKPKKQSK